MVAAIDDSVGQIVAALKEMDLEDSTTIIFTSDNGGLCTQKTPGPTSNLPLRSGKGWLYEGGIRVPLLMRIPGVTQPGQVIDQPVLSTDYFPTILELAEQPAMLDLALDGESVVPLFTEAAVGLTRPLAWHYPHYHGSMWTPGAAFRDGDWKLIEFYEFSDAELYNLRADPGEHQNLASEEPIKFTELRAKLRAWQESVKATMPQPNPEWTP
jgi:arylsulfatase A-like enzyme